MIKEKKLESVYLRCMEYPNKVLEIFNNFFGEEYVDMQNYMSLKAFTNSFLNQGIYSFFYDDDLDKFNVTDRTTRIGNLDDDTLVGLLDCIDIESVLELMFDTLDPINILIHFPTVIVTNEFDKSVEIKHLYVKQNINYRGCTREIFTMNRSEYSAKQFFSNYMHSHVSHINKQNLSTFQIPCLGTGPIRTTIESLSLEFDENLWDLYCLELSKYVRTESISGIPYHRLEKIGYNNIDMSYITDLKAKKLIVAEYMRPLIRHFIIDFIKNTNLQFNYVNGVYNIALSHKDFNLLVSNKFIEWYNDKYNNKEYTFEYSELHNNILQNRVVKPDGIYKTDSLDYDFTYYIGKEICTFKGKKVELSITEIDNNEYHTSILLKHNIVLYIKTLILNIVNNYYGKSEYNTVDTKTLFI